MTGRKDLIMGFDFKQAAIDATTLSELMTDRQKVSTDDIIKNYPEGVTIVGFDFVEGKDGSYPIFIFTEAPKCFFSGGVVMAKIANKWLANFDDDIDACNKALAESGGVKMKLEHGRTKNGNNIIKAYPV